MKRPYGAPSRRAVLGAALGAATVGQLGAFASSPTSTPWGALPADGDGDPDSDGVTPSASGPWPTRVSRSGTQLVAQGSPIRLAGVNAYWLGLNDNYRVRGVPTVPRSDTVDHLFAAVRNGGGTVVRCHTLGTSYGDAEGNGAPTLMPTPGVFRSEVWTHLDQVVDSAARRGLRLIPVMSDRWIRYHGSGPELARMVLGRSLSDSDALAAFYGDSRVRQVFSDYLVAWLTHRSSISGLRFADDPTIMAVELGNEMWDVPVDWTVQMAAVVKSVAPQTLVVDPAGGLRLPQCHAALDCGDVDIVGIHGYPRSIAAVGEALDLAGRAGKVCMVGEYDWTTVRQDGLPKEGLEDGSLAQWYDALQAAPGLGVTAAWSVFVPSAGVHRDGYELYVPTRNTVQTTAGGALSTYLRRVNGT